MKMLSPFNSLAAVLYLVGTRYLWNEKWGDGWVGWLNERIGALNLSLKQPFKWCTFMILISPLLSPIAPYISHLKVSENPYTSGIIASRDTALSIIVASGKSLPGLLTAINCIYFKKPSSCALKLNEQAKIFLKGT